MKRSTHKEPNWELPSDAGPNCVGYRVRMLSRVVSAIYDEALASLKLKISQFTILAVLSRHRALAAADLCRMVMMDKSTASRNLQRMRRRGWIAVVQGNGRGQEVSLAPEGVRVLRTAYPLWRKAQEEATHRLGAEGLASLTTVLARVKG